MNDERIQSIVLEAISQVEQTSNPAKYAEFNFNVYEIACKAVEIASKTEFDKKLSIRILNFVAPYIPEYIHNECMNIIKDEYDKQRESR